GRRQSHSHFIQLELFKTKPKKTNNIQPNIKPPDHILSSLTTPVTIQIPTTTTSPPSPPHGLRRPSHLLFLAN
ncbi:hypothetical protein LINGRAHAP2_LOCUS19952, partial [Linum grandiflorum]